jgi:hypothetical protein
MRPVHVTGSFDSAVGFTVTVDELVLIVDDPPALVIFVNRDVGGEVR